MLALVSIVLLAFFTEAVVGFGSTVLSVTLGAHWMPIEVILPSLVPVNMVLSMVLVARSFRSVDVKLLLRRVAPLVALGALAGMALFRFQSGRGLRLGFAVFVVTLATAELVRGIRATQQTAKLGAIPSTVLLVMGGVAHGLFGSGGPLVVYVTGRELEGKTRFRATLSALWIALNGALIVNYALSHMLTRESLRGSLLLLPTVPLAVLVGEWVHRRVAERRFRVAVWCVLLVAGMALLFRSRAA